MKLLSRLRKRRQPIAPPAIRIDTFSRSRPDLYQQEAQRDESRKLISELCRFETLNSATFRNWAMVLKEPWRPHRKLWELAFLCQALAERDMLRPGTHGLGFAVGAEKLPAVFAARGCKITATDLPANDERRTPWAHTGQWVGEREALNADRICDEAGFRQRVEFRPVDMNQVPNDLTGFDFTWSTCSFEHCGSLELGLDFLLRQMDCLRPGGIAVHTTEFNLSSNDETLGDGPCVIYRLCDIENAITKLQLAGHEVEPLDLNPGSHELDQYIENHPYCDWNTTPPDKVKHLRLNLAGHASTSIALIIRKAA